MLVGKAGFRRNEEKIRDWREKKRICSTETASRCLEDVFTRTGALFESVKRCCLRAEAWNCSGIFRHLWIARSGSIERNRTTVEVACRSAILGKRQFFFVRPDQALSEDLGNLPLEGISRVIRGGESGPGARPMREPRVLSICEQCKAANMPFFFKQWGGVRKKVSGRTLLGRTYGGFPRRLHHPRLPAAVQDRALQPIVSSCRTKLGGLRVGLKILKIRSARTRFRLPAGGVRR